MNRKAKSNAAKAAVEPTFTSGEIFDDGSSIELVRGPRGSRKPDLLLWDGTLVTIGPQAKYRGRIYEAPEIPASVYRGVLLPSDCEDGGSFRELYGEITTLFREVNFPDRESRLLASFSMVTWSRHGLPIAPAVEIAGADRAAGIEVLRLLYCVCRHPLLLAEVTPGAFRSLPLELSLTLLLNQPELKPAMSRVLSASSHRGLHLPGNRGTLVDPFGPKVIFGEGEVGDRLHEGSVRISMAPAQFHPRGLDENACKKIADHFQPRLLHFRLSNYSTSPNSPVEAPSFTSETRRLAGVLAGCLPADAEFASEVVQLLQPQDEELRAQRNCDISCVLIEVLWGLVHHGTKQEITVAELADDANGLLRSRGEILVYSAEEIGWKLRALGVPRHPSAAGRQVLLGRDNRRRVHALAHAYDLTCARSVVGDCPECATREATVST